jgi:hypothetical protein
MTENDPYRTSAAPKVDPLLVGFMMGPDFIYYDSIEYMRLEKDPAGTIILAIHFRSGAELRYSYPTTEEAHESRTNIGKLKLKSMEHFARLQGSQKDE